MCGIAGLSGIKDQRVRLDPIQSLGYGIDARGGHASGYVSIQDGKARVGKRVGTWDGSKKQFSYGASLGETVMMHARYATMGAKELVTNAHPFTIKRNSVTALYGCHNGMLGGTFSSALQHGRPHTVDSRELFELLADDDLAGIQRLDGYGVITWITPGDPNVRMAMLSGHADVYVVSVVGGGMVWGSTRSIVDFALAYSNLEPELEYKVDTVGMVYLVTPTMLATSDKVGVKVSETFSYGYGWGDFDYGDPDDDFKPVYNSRKRTRSYSYPYSPTYYPNKSIDDGIDYSKDDDDAARLTGLANGANKAMMTTAEWERWGRWAEDGRYLGGPKQAAWDVLTGVTQEEKDAFEGLMAERSYEEANSLGEDVSESLPSYTIDANGLLREIG